MLQGKDCISSSKPSLEASQQLEEACVLYRSVCGPMPCVITSSSINSCQPGSPHANLRIVCHSQPYASTQYNRVALRVPILALLVLDFLIKLDLMWHE